MGILEIQEVFTVAHIVSDRVRTPVASAGTVTGTRKPFLPTTRRGWLIAVSIVAVIILAPLGWLTDGRVGLVCVTGNSMSSVMPQGSFVITLPLFPSEGDYVVASASAPNDQSDTTRQDNSRSLVVKEFISGRLVSTDDANVYSHYECRGLVVARIPIQKILFWRDKGTQKPVAGAVSYHTPSEISAIRAEADIRRTRFNAILHDLDSHKSQEIVLGHTNPMVVAVVVEKVTVDTWMWAVQFNPKLHLIAENDVGLRVYRSQKPVLLDAKIEGSPQRDLVVKAVLP